MDEKNKTMVLKLLNGFSSAECKVLNQGTEYDYTSFDNLRLKVIGNIRELLTKFFNNQLTISSFKIMIDSINKHNPLWGFRGSNGQMFFNILYNCSQDKNKLKNILINTLNIPENITEAKGKIDMLSDYVKEVSGDVTDKRKVPRQKSILFFLSYFWQIQDPNKFQIFYSSLEAVLLELGLMTQKETLGDYYGEFNNINEKIRKIFSEEMNVDVSLWYIEHVFWWYYTSKQNYQTPPQISSQVKETTKSDMNADYIPPIVSNMDNLSKNESNPADFEKCTAKLFTILGFDVELRGQGKGRTTDIVAKGYCYRNKPYNLLIDCKARGKGDFRVNAGEERTIIEYIKNFLFSSPKERSSDLNYLLVSSGFNGDSEDAIRKIKSETNVDVALISVDALLFLLSLKLRTWDLDIDKIRDIFQRSGRITKDFVQEELIGR